MSGTSITLTFAGADPFGRQGKIDLNVDAMLQWWEDKDGTTHIVTATGVVCYVVESRDQISRMRRTAAMNQELELERAMIQLYGSNRGGTRP